MNLNDGEILIINNEKKSLQDWYCGNDITSSEKEKLNKRNFRRGGKLVPRIDVESLKKDKN